MGKQLHTQKLQLKYGSKLKTFHLPNKHYSKSFLDTAVYDVGLLGNRNRFWLYNSDRKLFFKLV